MIRRTLAIACVLLLAAVLWTAWWATGRDALPTEGAVHTAAGPDAPIDYHVQQPASGTSKGTVVLLASLGRPSSDFNALAGALAQAGWRTLAVSSRGMGRWHGAGLWGPPTLAGFADDVLAVLQHAGVPEGERVHLIGHAFGNRVARMFATRYPARTHSVVLLAAGDQPQLPAAVERDLRLSVLGPLPWALRDAAVRRAFVAPGEPVPPAWQRGWSLWAALAQSRAVRATPAEAFRAAGHVPLLVVQPQDDTVAPAVGVGDRLARELGAQVRVVPVAHAGHALLPEQPDAVARAVLDFLNAAFAGEVAKPVSQARSPAVIHAAFHRNGFRLVCRRAQRLRACRTTALESVTTKHARSQPT